MPPSSAPDDSMINAQLRDNFRGLRTGESLLYRVAGMAREVHERPPNTETSPPGESF